MAESGIELAADVQDQKMGMTTTSSANSLDKLRQSSRLQKHYSQSRGKGENISIKWSNVEFSFMQADPKKSTILSKVFTEKKILKSVSGS